MTNHTPDPEKAPVPQDELDRLEEMHRRLKENQEAWRNLLEGLGNLKKNDPPTPPTEKPRS